MERTLSKYPWLNGTYTITKKSRSCRLKEEGEYGFVLGRLTKRIANILLSEVGPTLYLSELDIKRIIDGKPDSYDAAYFSGGGRIISDIIEVEQYDSFLYSIIDEVIDCLVDICPKMDDEPAPLIPIVKTTPMEYSITFTKTILTMSKTYVTPHYIKLMRVHQYLTAMNRMTKHSEKNQLVKFTFGKFKHETYLSRSPIPLIILVENLCENLEYIIDLPTDDLITIVMLLLFRSNL